jgi:ATP-binding cassette, subfamily B (MDR/TAP), member 1
VQQGNCTFLGLMKAVTALLFTAICLGSVAALTPDFSSASVAATSIFWLLDRPSRIDPLANVGKSLDRVEGRADMNEAEFEYPTCPDVAVMRGLSLNVAPGKTVALVGQSGCGKSTVVALMERFYDLRAGSVSFEGENVKDLHVSSARNHMALVQQEPNLFNRSIRENIVYGLPHVEGLPVTDEQIVLAARAANAHYFITELPRGYDTVVGERGAVLSADSGSVSPLRAALSASRGCCYWTRLRARWTHAVSGLCRTR